LLPGKTALGVLVAAAVLAAFPALAQPTDEVASLKREAAQLRQFLDELERKIHALEGGNGASAAASTPATNVPDGQAGASFFLLQRGWSEIKPGTPKARVDTLLGKPERVMHVNGDLVWYYVYPGLGRGSVFFSVDEKVTAVQAPTSGWSW
jgi:hypothetical protein